MKTRVMEVDPLQPDPAAIEAAARVIRDGGLVGFPTETVYGVGANALDAAAVARIFEAKGRPASDPLIVHLAHIGRLAQVAASVPPSARQLALAFWAGPLTLILPKTPVVPDIVTAGLPSVAVRVPSNRVARALMEMSGVPVAAPSANRFSRPSPTTAAHVLADLDGRVDLVLDGGPSDIGLESTIVDFTVSPPLVRRPGGLGIEAIAAIVPEIQIGARYESGELAQVAPGQLLRHYAPKAPLTLYLGDPAEVVARLAQEVRALAPAGERIGILAPEDDISALMPELAGLASSGRVMMRAYGSRREPERAGRELFGAMRSLDQENVSMILATGVEGGPLGPAIQDRLIRAADGRVRKV